MRRLRVCELITELRPGGAERSVYELATRLDRRLFDVQVAALRGGQVADWLAEAGVKVTVLGMRRKWDLWRLPALVRLLARERIDLLHTHLFHADLAGRPAACLASVPHLVHTVRTVEGRFRPWQFAFARAAAGCCDRIVCVSQAARDFHSRRSGLPRGRYTVICNGVDAGAFARDEAARDRLRGQWGIADDEPLFAFVGKLRYEKGLDVLLEAVDMLATRGGAVRLVVAGDGPGQAAAQRFLDGRDAGRAINMLGFTRDVAGVLSAADALVVPSRWEGLPLSVMEAMAAGVPVIAARVGGVPELVADGRTGLLVPPEDPQSLADAIERLASDSLLRTRLGTAGLEVARHQYTIAATIEAHEKLYTEIAAPAPAEGQRQGFNR